MKLLEPKKRIDKIEYLEKKLPDLHPVELGEYTDKLSPWAIVCRDGEYLAILEKEEEYELPSEKEPARFFIPHSPYPIGSPQYQADGKRRFNRAEEFYHARWWYIVVGVAAEVSVTSKLGTQTNFKITMWDFIPHESDCSEEVFLNTKQELMDEMSSVLRRLGFGRREIKKAVNFPL